MDNHQLWHRPVKEWEDNELSSLLARVAERPAWMARAHCRTYDGHRVGEFFPPKGDSRSITKPCDPCTVKAECLEYAIANNERDGLWGGTSGRERQKLIRIRRKAAA
jgi:WhiB family redox-sensing transcriptional regulator